jgi:hypothetical protein
MMLFWLLCVGLVLGGLLASLARQIPWSTLQVRRARKVRVRADLPHEPARRLTRDPRGPVLGPDWGMHAGPPDFPGGVG